MPCEVIGPAGAGAPRVLVIHSWWGLTEGTRAFGAALADRGFRVALADLFDGKTASTEDAARRLRAAPRRQPMYRTLEAALEALDGPSVGVVGLSMGGHWAVWLSQRPAYRIDAAVLYYAARGGDFSASRAAYLAHFAEDDPWVSRGARRSMERAIAAAGRSYQALTYPGSRHWFAEVDRADAYSPEDALLAFDRTVAHLRRYLRAEHRNG